MQLTVKKQSQPDTSSLEQHHRACLPSLVWFNTLSSNLIITLLDNEFSRLTAEHCLAICLPNPGDDPIANLGFILPATNAMLEEYRATLHPTTLKESP